jgi:calcium-dependent protein kinase
VAESVKRYAQANRFQKAVRHSMATNLTSSELHKLRNIFEGLDTEGHGTITIARLKEVLEAEAAETGQNPFGGIDLSNFDIDGDGEIDWQEFVAAIMDDHELHNEENLAKVFRQLDVDSSGTLSLTEISTILGNEHQFSRQVLEAVKSNRGTGDGVETIQMTFDEFKNLMLSKGDLSSVSKKRRRDTIKNFSFSEVQTDENAEQNV